jgi:hypothetical protein
MNSVSLKKRGAQSPPRREAAHLSRHRRPIAFQRHHRGGGRQCEEKKDGQTHLLSDEQVRGRVTGRGDLWSGGL